MQQISKRTARRVLRNDSPRTATCDTHPPRLRSSLSSTHHGDSTLPRKIASSQAPSRDRGQASTDPGASPEAGLLASVKRTAEKIRRLARRVGRGRADVYGADAAMGDGRWAMGGRRNGDDE